MRQWNDLHRAFLARELRDLDRVGGTAPGFTSGHDRQTPRRDDGGAAPVVLHLGPRHPSMAQDIETLRRLDRPDVLLASTPTGAKATLLMADAYSVDGVDAGDTEEHHQETCTCNR